MRYSLIELARATGTPVATLRSFVRQGIVPAAGGAGEKAWFGEEQFYRACAANALRKRSVGARAIKAQLDRASDAELCAIAGLPAPPRQISPEEIERAHRSYEPEPAPRETWSRIVLRPGVELHVRTDVGEDALSVARAIEQAYAR